MTENIAVSLKNIHKSFGDTEVIKGLDLYIRENEFLTFLGPSGCGKTTLLRMIGGFEQPTEGDIILNGKKINKVPPHKRPVNTIFQRYALFPHMNVAENIAFGLKIRKRPKDEIEKKIKEMLALVNLEGYEKRKPSELSGGQQQRIAIARALVNEPKVILLDEPLSALDLKLRREMQAELKAMQKRLGITFIFVTHDQEEALTMSDTIVVLDKGQIQQVGTPEEIYNNPVNSFVAKFIGETNIFDGKSIDDFSIEVSGKELEYSHSGFSRGEQVDVVIRPEDISLVSPEDGIIAGIVENVMFKGVYYEIIVKENNIIWKIQSIYPKEKGDRVGMKVDSEHIHIMKKRQLN